MPSPHIETATQRALDDGIRIPENRGLRGLAATDIELSFKIAA